MRMVGYETTDSREDAIKALLNGCLLVIDRKQKELILASTLSISFDKVNEIIDSDD